MKVHAILMFGLIVANFLATCFVAPRDNRLAALIVAISFGVVWVATLSYSQKWIKVNGDIINADPKLVYVVVKDGKPRILIQAPADDVGYYLVDAYDLPRPEKWKFFSPLDLRGVLVALIESGYSIEPYEDAKEAIRRCQVDSGAVNKSEQVDHF